MRTIYESRNIPAHSCIMLATQEEARRFPLRDLMLGFCASCGFISNTVFDPSVQAYTRGYEEQQSFSARFRTFQTLLIDRLIQRYNVHGKHVVEIGCGKGDFLIELCERGGNHGVGIDPACDPDRMRRRGEGRVRFIQDLYSPKYSDLPCDFLCCRHTLEHIRPTHDFIGEVRDVIGDRRDVLVFFEVPGVERVLAECAFWDVYYEHCSYFSLGSLGRVFRSNQFDLLELEADFEDQYLLVVARPTDGPTVASLPGEDDLRRLADLVTDFRNRVPGMIDAWRERIAGLRARNKRIAIWGSGSKCVSFLSTVGLADGFDAVVDINPYRHGKYLAGSGKEVVAPGSLKSAPPDVVLVMNPVYCSEIQRGLDAMGVNAELALV
jgi:SAM-dependent methyltransferase